MIGIAVWSISGHTEIAKRPGYVVYLLVLAR